VPVSVPDDALAAALAAVVANTTGYAGLVGGIVRTAVEAATPLIRAAEARALAELCERRADAVPLYHDSERGKERRATFLDCADIARKRAEQLEGKTK
jgi:hypothetical protein